ncbi:MAG: protein kinase [Deltaproteobacteria bacterium]|nr:protein kinase [Deltaproteobacteria bacterium]
MGIVRKTSRSKKSKDPLLGQVVAGRYRLESLLGEGGMGVVYRARHVLIDRVVALKLIRPDLRGETHLRAWMVREARAANRVDHAHIVDIHDVGETEEGELYLVMEYLIGDSLSSQIAKGPMPIARAVDILEQMTAALARAHDLGVVHRDLKSDNIMITARGGRKDFVKILDFGLAALTRDPRLAPKGAVFGTPEYMSPEQARGEDAISSSDLYALGVLFFEMLTGRLPFRSGDRDELLEMQRKAKAPSPRKYRPDIPEQAEHIILKLLEKKAEDRFRDGHHLKEELKEMQRALPSREWDAPTDAAPVAPPPPPPAQTPGVVEWSGTAANFLRAVARAYPDGDAPTEVQGASDKIWELASRASRLEGELESHSKKLEAIEKRGRGLRAEIGRKVEDLAGEESRALRDASSERDVLSHLILKRKKAQREQHTAQAEVQAAGDHIERNRRAYESLGAARAQVEVLEGVSRDYERRARSKEDIAAERRKQIEELRAQLSSANAIQRGFGKRSPDGPRANRQPRTRGPHLRKGLRRRLKPPARPPPRQDGMPRAPRRHRQAPQRQRSRRQAIRATRTDGKARRCAVAPRQQGPEGTRIDQAIGFSATILQFKSAILAFSAAVQASPPF